MHRTTWRSKNKKDNRMKIQKTSMDMDSKDVFFLYKNAAKRWEEKMQNFYDRERGSLTVYMPKEIDHHEAGKLRTETDRLIETYHVRRLVFDFAHTEFMDSSGIGVIIGRCRNLGYQGGEVFARNLNERVRKIFFVSGLQKIIKII